MATSALDVMGVWNDRVKSYKCFKAGGVVVLP